jgi:type I restriction enzyme S subunit
MALRFKKNDGTDFPEWEEKKLGEIGEIYQPKTISQAQLSKFGYDVYGANGIIGKYSQYNHDLSQVIVTCRGSTCGTVNFTNPKSWITGNAMVINLDGESTYCDKKFMFYCLTNTDFKYLITGSGQPQITSNIKTHKLQIPLLEEQQKIANLLSDLDDLIYKTEDKLNLLKELKKSLMQHLFKKN